MRREGWGTGDGEDAPLISTLASALKATTLIFAICPGILRIVFPVVTSQRKTDLSPPDDANRALSCALTVDVVRRVLWLGADGGAHTAMDSTSYPCAEYVLISVPRLGFQRRTVRSCPPVRTYLALPWA